MPQFSEDIDIKRPPEEVWRAISTPERWFEGYLETRSRSAEYPGPGTRDDRLYRTRMKEEVEARVTRSEAPSVLEEDQEGKTFSRHVRYSLSPSPAGTLLRVDDKVDFKGLGKLAAPDRIARHPEALGDVAAEAEGCRGGRRVGRPAAHYEPGRGAGQTRRPKPPYLAACRSGL